MWATAFPAATTARYFMHADEANRVIEMYNWPASGDATRVWAVNPDVFGWDSYAQTGPYQPFRLNNLINDDGTIAWKIDTGTLNFNRPELLIGRGVHYDPMTGTMLQRSGEWPFEPYGPRKSRGCGVGVEAQDCGNPVCAGAHYDEIIDTGNARLRGVGLSRGRVSISGLTGDCTLTDPSGCQACFNWCVLFLLTDIENCGGGISCESAVNDFNDCIGRCHDNGWCVCS